MEVKIDQSINLRLRRQSFSFYWLLETATVPAKPVWTFLSLLCMYFAFDHFSLSFSLYIFFSTLGEFLFALE